MELSKKIIGLRKSNGLSQEDLAEKLDVSRQAISRWESGTAMPDANNILQLSKLFEVTEIVILYHTEFRGIRKGLSSEKTSSFGRKLWTH